MSRLEVAATIGACSGAHLRETRPIAKEAGMVRGLKLKLFAALLLRAMAQEQAEVGAEAVSPRHPSVARRLGLQPDSPELAIGERYLQEQGYIRPIAPSEEGGPFVITEVGWEDLGYQHSAEGWRRRPWWRRMLGV
jgi:hypothetical protein